MISQAGVYWPFKALLTGSGIVISETATGITIGTTGAGPGGGDMLMSVYATRGLPNEVDHAYTADNCSGTVAHATLADTAPWGGITGKPTTFPADWGNITSKPTQFPSDWSIITSKPTTFPPSPHGPTHLPTGTDAVPAASSTAAGWLNKVSGKNTDYVGGDNATHPLPGANENGDFSPPAVPTIYDDEFTSATLAGKWTIAGMKTGATVGLAGNDFLQMAIAFGTTGGVTLTAQENIITTPPTGQAASFMFQFKLRFLLGPFLVVAASTDVFVETAIILSVGNKSVGLWLAAESFTDAATNQYTYPLELFVYHGSGQTNLQNSQYLTMSGIDLRVRMGVSGPNFVIQLSNDGLNWLQVYSENFSTGGGFGGAFPTLLTLDLDNGGGGGGSSNGAAMVAFDYVRKIA